MSKTILNGHLILGDFENKTVTFKIEGGMTVQQGKYTIVPTKVYEELHKPTPNINSTESRTNDDVLIYWAKQLENKPMSVGELVENAKWLIDDYSRNTKTIK